MREQQPLRNIPPSCWHFNNMLREQSAKAQAAGQLSTQEQEGRSGGRGEVGWRCRALMCPCWDCAVGCWAAWACADHPWVLIDTFFEYVLRHVPKCGTKLGKKTPFTCAFRLKTRKVTRTRCHLETCSKLCKQLNEAESLLNCTY